MSSWKLEVEQLIHTYWKHEGNSAFTLVPCLACSTTLKMEAEWSSETSFELQQTA
jgi:hypothetical protein